MYIHDSITLQIAQDKQREMLAAAEQARLARQALAIAAKPSVSRRRVSELVRRLRAQAQS